MAQHKRKKLSAEQRQALAKARPPAASTTPAKPAKTNPASGNGAAAATDNTSPAPPIKASFRPGSAARRSAAIGGEEQFTAIRRDLRFMAVLITGFSLVIAGLGYLGATTPLFADLGAALFTLWQ